MEELDNSALQDLVYETNGRNAFPKLFAESHFILETDDYEVTLENSFGATSGTEFQTTTKFTFNGTKKVYALCKGTILIQPSTISGLVNVILKPFKQPINELPIKFIIYRGLKKEDFFDEDNGNWVLTGDEETGTGLIKKIWKEFNQLYGETGLDEEPPILSSGYIGFPTSENPQNDLTKLIDSFFFKTSKTEIDEITGDPIEQNEISYELPIVQRGLHIGNAVDALGIDIVLNNGDYYIENDLNPFQFDLNYARSGNFSLDTDIGTTNFEKKLVRESCTQFIDIVAFYGLHCNGAGKVFIDDDIEEPLTNKDEIFELIEDCYRCTTQYLYIDAERQRSYNFYGNYQTSETELENLKIGTTTENTTEVVFGLSGWPIHMFSNGEKFAQLLTDYHPETVLYSHIGVLTTENETNFVKGENILPDEIDEEEILHYTKPIGFHFDQIEQNEEFENISSIVRVIYKGFRLPPIEEFNFEGEGTGIFHQLKEIDDVLGIINIIPFNTTNNDNECQKISDENTELIFDSYNKANISFGIIKICRTNDSILPNENDSFKRVTFETTLQEIYRNSGFVFQNAPIIESNTNMNLSSDLENNILYHPDFPYSLKSMIFTDYNFHVIKGLKLFDINQSGSYKLILGIGNDELVSFISLLGQLEYKNPKWFFKDTTSTDEYYVSIEDVKYKVYDLLVLAENDEGQLQMISPEIPFKVYTIDNRIFFSEFYSKDIYLEMESYSIEFIPEVGI